MTHPPTDLERELAIEQAHVDVVYARLAKTMRSARDVAAQSRSLYASDRMTYMRDEDSTALFERDAFSFQAAKRIAILDAEHEGLVFGRLDNIDLATRYIGRIGVRDENYAPLVIDWRAPAAEPFYRATPTNPMNVVRRRVLRCRNDKVIGIEDDLLDSTVDTNLTIIGDGALMAALSRARGPRMKDIVATIQAEQDEAIRAPYHGVTVISGGPGTGKTVVALHRAAYLLYSNRRRFERGGILVVGPSPVFMNYIERVLPSLGEESVTLRAIGAVASDVVPVSSTRVDSPAAAAIKGSLRMVSLLKRLVALPMADFGPTGPAITVTVKGEVLTLRDRKLAQIRRGVILRGRVNAGRAVAEDAVAEALAEQLPDHLDLDPDLVDSLIREHPAFQMFMNAWWPGLTPTQVLRRLDDLRVVAQTSDGLLSSQEQAILASSFRAETWSVADTALLDELMALLGPVPEGPDTSIPMFLPDGTELTEVVTVADTLSRRREADTDDDPQQTYAHVLVDEAQDISPMQWRMLRRRGAQASWTIVGDVAQSSWPKPDESDQALAELIGRAPHRSFRLSTNYRSPSEVFDLAAAVIRQEFPDADIPTAVRSTGIQPRLVTASDITRETIEQVNESATLVKGTIGVICPPSRVTGLRQELAGHRVGDRLAVVTALEAKGLEYDAAIVVAPDDIVAESPGGIRVLYVALTRPTQRLITIDPRTTSGDVRAQWRESLTSPSTGSG